jgi:hypothetical protein
MCKQLTGCYVTVFLQKDENDNGVVIGLPKYEPHTYHIVLNAYNSAVEALKFCVLR